MSKSSRNKQILQRNSYIYIYTSIQYLKSACTSNVKLHFLNMLFFWFLLCSQAAAPFPMWANINKLVLYTYRTIFTLLYVKSVHMKAKYLKKSLTCEQKYSRLHEERSFFDENKNISWVQTYGGDISNLLILRQWW